jgi:hypothetical protein
MFGIGGAHFGRKTRAIEPDVGCGLHHGRFNIGNWIKRNLHPLTQLIRRVTAQERILMPATPRSCCVTFEAPCLNGRGDQSARSRAH